MLGQISIFDLLNRESETRFSWDNDIIEINKMRHDFARSNNLKIAREEWKVWGHVPQFGFRMSIGLEVTREIVEEDDFWNGLDEIVKNAKIRKIELSPFAPYFFNGSNTTIMSIFTTFMDNERRKVKNK